MMADPATPQEQNAQYDFVPGDFLKSLFNTAKAVLLSPRLFYKSMKTERGLQNPALFLEFYRLYLIAWGLSYAFSIRVSRAALAILMTIVTYIVLGQVVFYVLGGQQPTTAP